MFYNYLFQHLTLTCILLRLYGVHNCKAYASKLLISTRKYTKYVLEMQTDKQIESN